MSVYVETDVEPSWDAWSWDGISPGVACFKHLDTVVVPFSFRRGTV